MEPARILNYQPKDKRRSGVQLVLYALVLVGLLVIAMALGIVHVLLTPE